MKFDFNFYKILGVDDKASDKIIKAAYRELSKKFHPDNPETGDEEFFKKIGIAYSILKDKKKRGLYDLGQFDALEPESEIMLSEEEENLIVLFQKELKNGHYGLILELNQSGSEKAIRGIVRSVRESLNDEIHNYNNDQYALEENLNLLKELKSGIVFNSKHTKYNLMELSINELISLKEEELSEIKIQRELAKRMLDILEDFSGGGKLKRLVNFEKKRILPDFYS